MQVFQVPQYMNMVGIDTGTTTNIIHLEEEEPAVVQLPAGSAAVTVKAAMLATTMTTKKVV
jgi:hypothetical protein